MKHITSFLIISGLFCSLLFSSLTGNAQIEQASSNSSTSDLDEIIEPFSRTSEWAEVKKDRKTYILNRDGQLEEEDY